MQSALVTGGAGFIGSHLVKALRAKNVAVRVLDNLATGNLGNLVEAASEIEIVRGDIRSASDCRAACAGVDAVFHLAALISVPKSVLDPVEANAVNVDGTLNLLVAARDAGVRRFVFTSSAAIYGDTAIVPTHEQVLPAPNSPYGVQKIAGEYYARSFTHLYGLETVRLRYFNVFGARQDPRSEYAAVIPQFLTRLLRGEAPTVFGDGEQTRDFCHVSDIVAANLLAAETTNPGAIGQAFNIACGVRISLNRLLAAMRAVTGADLPATYTAPRVGDIQHSGADITRARTLLEYRPATDLETGLRDAVAWYRTQEL